MLEENYKIEGYNGGLVDQYRINIVTEDGFNWKAFAKEHIMNQRYYNKAKIDVYDQVVFEWDKFAEYCWNNKKKLLKME